MSKAIAVQFARSCKVYDFAPCAEPLEVGDAVIVETKRGMELAKVVGALHDVDEDTLPSPLVPVIRKASEVDLQIHADNKERAKEAHRICLEKIIERDMDMKLVDVEYTIDNSRIIFYFTADGRVDFRELVKDLAGIFHTRIELHQIGVRDEAKMIGGIGICGRGLCCHRFLDEFAPVSMKMAKEQRLSLNPSKISGCCGRLMCCLNYENENYVEWHEKDPSLTAADFSLRKKEAEAERARQKAIEVAAEASLQASPEEVLHPEVPAKPRREGRTKKESKEPKERKERKDQRSPREKHTKRERPAQRGTEVIIEELGEERPSRCRREDRALTRRRKHPNHRRSPRTSKRSKDHAPR